MPKSGGVYFWIEHPIVFSCFSKNIGTGFAEFKINCITLFYIMVEFLQELFYFLYPITPYFIRKINHYK